MGACKITGTYLVLELGGKGVRIFKFEMGACTFQKGWPSSLFGLKMGGRQIFLNPEGKDSKVKSNTRSFDC